MQSHQSLLIPCPTGSEWLLLCQAVSSIMFYPTTNSMWVTLLYFFARQSHQSFLIPWPTGSEWHCFISLPGSLINHVLSHNQQYVSDTAFFLCMAVTSIISHPMINRKWVNCSISLPGSLVNQVLSHNQQFVSDTALSLCKGVSSIISHPMTNRK